MHIEIQVALNFVISYLYNKLPRRRVNIFGEELEKALKDKFQGHWYPEKPFKGSAFRCLKIGDPHDSVLSRAARESGVPISDILENLPHELSVWVDPGEVSYRIGEKGAVKILYSENSDNHEENTSADREVNKTFNPEAQVFRPIDIINNGINGLSLSPKTSPHAGSSPHSVSSASPTYKGSPNPAAVAVMNGGGNNVCNNGSGNGGSGSGGGNNGVPYMTRLQAPLTFTTATFAQTKFGSTKLKTNSKRSNSSAYRMSPTEFSNYIKQRAMQQQLHHGNGGPQQNHYGPIGAISPARSISPNPLNGSGMGMGNQGNDPYFMHNMSNNMYPPQYNNGGGHRNIYDAQYQLESAANGSLYGGVNNTIGHNKFGAYLEPHGFYGGIGNHVQKQQQQSPQHHNQQQQQQSQQQPNGIAKTAINGIMENANNKDINAINGGGIGLKNTTTTITVTVTSSGSGSGNDSEPQSPAPPTPTSISSSSMSPSGSINGGLNGSGGNNTNNTPTNTNNTNNMNNQDSNSNSKLIDGLSSFYSNAATGYQQLLVAN